MKKDYTQIVSDAYQEMGEDAMKKLSQEFQDTGILVFDNFLRSDSLADLQKEAEELSGGIYRSSTSYNPFVADDQNTPSETLKNIRFTTEKGCVCYDQIPDDSILKTLYNGEEFQDFLCQILGVPKIFPYADSLAGININYYDPGDSLEWHYDNCNFTITLLVKKPESGGIYEYFPNQRYDETGKEDYTKVEKMIDGTLPPETVELEEATLVLFRGTESLHRVTPIESGQRILVTFCYNPVAGISLSETSRMTFFGRLK